MKTKNLIWKQSDGEDVWKGEVKGVTLIHFWLEFIEEDKYLLTSNIKGMRKLVLRGLENAKFMAQEFFDSYAKSLME